MQKVNSRDDFRKVQLIGQRSLVLLWSHEGLEINWWQQTINYNTVINVMDISFLCFTRSSFGRMSSNYVRGRMINRSWMRLLSRCTCLIRSKFPCSPQDSRSVVHLVAVLIIWYSWSEKYRYQWEIHSLINMQPYSECWAELWSALRRNYLQAERNS